MLKETLSENGKDPMSYEIFTIGISRFRSKKEKEKTNALWMSLSMSYRKRNDLQYTLLNSCN